MSWITDYALQTFSAVSAFAIASGAAVLARRERRRRVVVLEPDGESINRGFYDYFVKVIDGATEEIIVTGEGFGFATPNSREAARAYHGAMEAALARPNSNVRLTRLQTRTPLGTQWANSLADLLESHGERFALYLFDNGPVQDIASVCVVDSRLKSCVVEMMLSADADLGDTPIRLASTGLFIHGRMELARAMKANINAMLHAPRVRRITDPAELRELAKADQAPHLYFAYGSNMDERQMLQRCPSAKSLGIKRLDGYDLVFNRKGDRRDGGVASIVTAHVPGSCVFGVLWELPREDILQLDIDEVPTSYKRIPIEVTDPDTGHRTACESYTAFPQPGPIQADEEYLQLILRAARHVGLPADYVERLSAHSSGE